MRLENYIMNIKESLQVLSENELRIKIIIPMMYALGCFDVRDTHGPQEKGKDVVYGINHLLIKKTYGAIIIKNNGNLRKGPSLDVLYRQAIDAMKEFENPNDPSGGRIKVYELMFVTAYDITPVANSYIFENCGANFPNLHIIDGNTLESIICEIISKHKMEDSNYQFNANSFNDYCERITGRTIRTHESMATDFEEEQESMSK